jgi:hypothetical protein
MPQRACHYLGHNWTRWTYRHDTDTYYRTCTQCRRIDTRRPTHPARPVAH